MVCILQLVVWGVLMLRRERLAELGLLRMGIVAVLRVQRRCVGGPSVSCALVVVDWGRRWVVVGVRIRWVTVVGQLVVRSRRTTEDGLVCLVTSVWRLSWASWSMIHGLCNVDVDLWWSLADKVIVVVGATPCLELLLALVESLWDDGCSSSSSSSSPSAMAALDEGKSQISFLSLRHCVHIQTHNSDVNQDEAPCRTAWRREQCRHKPQPGQCLGAFLDLGG